MTAEISALVDFVRQRLDEELAIADQASRGYNVEVTAHMTSEAHSAHVMHFDPEWVREDILRKLLIVDFEVRQQKDLREKLPDFPDYGFVATRILASQWQHHSEFRQSWIGG